MSFSPDGDISLRILSSNCECGHEKRDHVLPLIGKQGYGKCKVCLCERYSKVERGNLMPTATAGSQS